MLLETPEYWLQLQLPVFLLVEASEYLMDWTN